MKHTPKQIEALVVKLLHDINREYLTNRQIQVSFEENLKTIYGDRLLQNGWDVLVPVADDRWNKEEGTGIIIAIDDDSLEVVSYLDCSMGRPIPMRAEKNLLGKYELRIIPQ